MPGHRLTFGYIIHLKRMDRQEDRIKELCTSFGIEPTFYDIWGDERNVPIETLRVILDQISEKVERVEAQGAGTGSIFLPDLTVNSLLLKEGDKPFFQILSGHPLEGEVEWLLETESGNCMEGSFRAGELNQKEASYPCKHYLANVSISRDLEYGYHFINLNYKGKHIRKLLINAPTTCYVPEWLLSERKVYGINLQLYSIRSQTNLGVGDFGDLRSFGEGLKGSCLTILGMSPLNALFPHDPKMISPYSPCSRLFLNPIYVGIGDLLQLGKEAVARVRDMMGPPKGDGDYHSEFVRYEEIWAFKKALFEALYGDFKASHLHNGTPLSQEFWVYQKERGELLRYFSTFLALNEMFVKEKGYYSWHQWPMAFRDPFSHDVKEWAEKNGDRLQYYQFLFWMTERAFRMTKGQLNELGKLVYLDFPVGVNGSGFEPWYYKDLFVGGISIGAPPDEFNPKGQDWGFPPLNPMALQASDFKPFIETIRFNMKLADILRIDHIMGLRRLFWIPVGKMPKDGAYVRYPMEELLGILCLESHRNKCVVVGEDLGTVPEEIRIAMEEKKILSSSVLIFEKEGWRYKRPEEIKPFSVSTITTHDLPTLKGFWTGRDIEVRERLGLFETDIAKVKHLEARLLDKKGLIALLKELELISREIDDEELLDNFSDLLIKAFHKYLIKSPSKITMFAFEDLIGELDQKNFPGTVSEYPNWQKKLPLQIEGLLSHELFLWLKGELEKEAGPCP